MSLEINEEKKTPDFNIEYCHVYVDQNFNQEHEDGVLEYKKLIRKLDGNGKTYSTCVMIDDYSPKENLLVEKDFFSELKDRNALPNYKVYESDIVCFKNELLDVLNHRMAREYMGYIINKGYIPCSFFIMAWNAYRLGLLGKNNLKKEIMVESDFSIFAKETYTILPARFSEIEEKAREGLESSGYSDHLAKIHYIYY